MDLDIAEPTVEASPTDAQPQAEASIDSIQEFIATPEATQTDAQPAQQVRQPNDPVELQRKMDKERVNRLALEQQNAALQQQLLSLTKVQPKGEPDFNTDPKGWLIWRDDKLVEQVTKVQREEFNQLLNQSYENKWQSEHPDVDLSEVKAFQNQRGIRDIEDAYTLMTLPQRLSSVAATNQAKAVQQFKNPVQGAQPLRGTQTAGNQTINLKFQDMLVAYNQNPNIENTWPPLLKVAFHRELNAAKKALG